MKHFRGLTKDGKMVYGWYFYEKLNDKHYILVEPSLLADYRFDAIVGHIEVIPASVAQQVGLKDKNGKEIYEGDLVKISNHKCQLQLFEAIGRVTERYSAWGVTDLRIIKFEKYSPKTKPQDATDIMYFLNIFDHKHIKIIGNIHQNPKLLEKSK